MNISIDSDSPFFINTIEEMDDMSIAMKHQLIIIAMLMFYPIRVIMITFATLKHHSIMGIIGHICKHNLWFAGIFVHLVSGLLFHTTNNTSAFIILPLCALLDIYSLHRVLNSMNNFSYGIYLLTLLSLIINYVCTIYNAGLVSFIYSTIITLILIQRIYHGEWIFATKPNPNVGVLARMPSDDITISFDPRRNIATSTTVGITDTIDIATLNNTVAA